MHYLQVGVGRLARGGRRGGGRERGGKKRWRMEEESKYQGVSCSELDM